MTGKSNRPTKLPCVISAKAKPTTADKKRRHREKQILNRKAKWKKGACNPTVVPIAPQKQRITRTVSSVSPCLVSLDPVRLSTLQWKSTGQHHLSVPSGLIPGSSIYPLRITRGRDFFFLWSRFSHNICRFCAITRYQPACALRPYCTHHAFVARRAIYCSHNLHLTLPVRSISFIHLPPQYLHTPFHPACNCLSSIGSSKVLAHCCCSSFHLAPPSLASPLSHTTHPPSWPRHPGTQLSRPQKA